MEDTNIRERLMKNIDERRASISESLKNLASEIDKGTSILSMYDAMQSLNRIRTTMLVVDEDEERLEELTR